MTIKSLAAKLRRAADVLDDLLNAEVGPSNETSEVAKKLRKAFKRTKRKARKSGWTPEMRAKASRRMKKRLRNGGGKLKVGV